jgi:hypothetical protein
MPHVTDAEVHEFILSRTAKGVDARYQQHYSQIQAADFRKRLAAELPNTLQSNAATSQDRTYRDEADFDYRSREVISKLAEGEISEPVMVPHDCPFMQGLYGEWHVFWVELRAILAEPSSASVRTRLVNEREGERYKILTAALTKLVCRTPGSIG